MLIEIDLEKLFDTMDQKELLTLISGVCLYAGGYEEISLQDADSFVCDQRNIFDSINNTVANVREHLNAIQVPGVYGEEDEYDDYEYDDYEYEEDEYEEDDCEDCGCEDEDCLSAIFTANRRKQEDYLRRMGL